MSNQKFSDIKDFLKLEKLRHDKRVVVFLICLLISSALWFLNALSKDYETTIEYPVRYVNLPENRFLANDPPSEFELMVTAHGFALLRNKLHLTFTPIVLNVKRIIADSESADSKTYRITSSELVNRISSQISNEINIREIRPQSFTMILDSMESKRVKVIPDMNIQYQSQYNITSSITIQPPYVTVTGPGTIIDTISAVRTESKKFERVKDTIEESIDLALPEKVTASPQKVQLLIPVEEFTEKKLSVPVTIVGKPEGVNIRLFPSDIQVSFMVGLSSYAKISADDFLFTAAYEDMNSGQQNVEVNLTHKPGFISEIKYSPQTIEFLIEKQ